MGMKPEFINLLPMWVTWLWLVALTAVLVLHCSHLVKMGGEHRWFHASHILMLVSQIYMFAGMAYKWNWFPASWWKNIFWVSSAAIFVFLVMRMVQRRPVSFLWAIALIMQVSMAYMWMPKWAPMLTWALVVYFSLEAVAWVVGLMDDTKPSRAIGPRPHAAAAPAPDDVIADGSVKVRAEAKPALSFVSLAPMTLGAKLSMGVMAASMAYMFAAMQLMRSAMM